MVILQELEKKQRAELKRLKRENLSSFAIKGTDEEWGKALSKNKTTVISVKRYDPTLLKYDKNVNKIILYYSGEQKLGEAKGWDDVQEPQAKKKKFGSSGAGKSGSNGPNKKHKKTR